MVGALLFIHLSSKKKVESNTLSTSILSEK